MKVLVLTRGRVGRAEDWAATLEPKIGVACGGQSFQIDGDKPKMLRSSVTAGFANIADTIEQALEDDIVFRRSRVVLVGTDAEAGPKPIPEALVATDYSHWYNLVALLVLTFPDIHWVFATTPEEHRLMEAVGLDLHSLPDGESERLRHIVALRDDGYEPLFDPSGLRNLIKLQSFTALNVLSMVAGKVECPERRALAVVIDDEIEVAIAMAYVHYRQGYRTLMITTEKQLRDARHAGDITCAAESFTIEFPDASVGLEDLPPSARLALLPTLGRIAPEQRLVYTIDDRRDDARADYAGTTVIHRPFDGMADLVDHLGIKERPAGFVWHPANPELSRTGGRHAMPGFMTAAARRLLRRASEAGHAAYRQAIFALEAQELLLNRVPSLSLDAHLQRLGAELRLENDVPTLFGGSARDARIRLQPRFDEIDAEIGSMLRVIHNPTGERRAQLTGAFSAQLIGAMIDQYRQGYHFHEELATIAEQRTRDRRRGGAFYLAWVLRRPRNFFVAVIGWAAIFAALYTSIAIHYGAPCDVIVGARAMLISTFTMITIGFPPDDMFRHLHLARSGWFQAAATVECAVGLFHWALGFAHLYTLASRR